MRRSTSDLVGRPGELRALTAELERARQGLTCVTLEGEPGIGKTRLLSATADLATDAGFIVIGVAADEQIHGPFLLARAMIGCASLRDATDGTPVADAVSRAADAITGSDDPGVAARLAPEQQVLRTYDLAAVAFREAARLKPIAFLIDDVQWADDDSTRLLRYVLRTTPQSPLFVCLGIRAEATAAITEATALIADLDRLGSLRHLPLARFSQAATGEMLRRLLGGAVAPASVATIHAQSEGVPFVTQELARTYRSSGLLQSVDGTWTLGPSAERMVPSSVRTLIQRRALRVPAESRTVLGEAAVLGRSFSVADLEALRRAAPSNDGVGSIADALAPAVAAGLLAESTSTGTDHTFTHEQIRQFALTALPAARQRALHAALVDLLGGDSAPDTALAAVAQHALAAGDIDRATATSIRATEVALRARAPEEAIRIVDAALLVATSAEDRVKLLRARDDALAMMRRSGERLEVLVELSALTDALGDRAGAIEILLRRAAALRTEDDHSSAAALARDARTRALALGSTELELAACLELGQDLLRSDLGEGMTGVPTEADLDGAAEAYAHAIDLASKSGDAIAEASATRELGVVAMGRLVGAYQKLVESGALDIVRANLAEGATPEDIVSGGTLKPYHDEATTRFQRALDLFEKAGDRRGVMSSVIGLAQATWGTEIRFGSAQRIEDIRRLWTRMRSFTTETERAAAEAQMLFGITVFGLAKGAYDLALRRGEEAHRAGRLIGDRSIEFAAAGCVARAHIALGDGPAAVEWIRRAAAAAAAAPTVARSRQLEELRTAAAATSGDAASARDHIERLIAPSEGDVPAERCAFLGAASLVAARLAVQRSEDELGRLARTAAEEVVAVATALPGHPTYGSQARAALAVLSAASDAEAARDLAERAFVDWEAALVDDVPLDLFLGLAVVLGAAQGDAADRLRKRLRETAAFIARRIADDEVRARFFRAPLGRELVEVAGSPVDWTPRAKETHERADIGKDGDELLRLLAEGRTNVEIGKALGLETSVVAERLARLFSRIEVGSRAEATAFALREGFV